MVNLIAKVTRVAVGTIEIVEAIAADSELAVEQP